jgi:hypothetical protein
VKPNLSLIYIIRDFGSGQILLPRQIRLSPGIAKIEPWWLARRDYFSAKVLGLVSADGATNVYSLNRRAVSVHLHHTTNKINSLIVEILKVTIFAICQTVRKILGLFTSIYFSFY